LDPEEVEAALEEFQALSDATLNMQPEETPAYLRLLGWTERQPVKELRKRSTKRPLYNDFVQRADDLRGNLFELDLTVRRIASYPAPTNDAGVKTLYEVVGNTEQSQTFLYTVLVSELPKGMPTGDDLPERAKFNGYFLKLQGYYHGTAKPGDPPQTSPLLVGKLSWRPSTPVHVNPQAPSWVIWVGLAICGMIGVRLFMFIVRWRNASKTTERPVVERPAIADGAEGNVDSWVTAAKERELRGAGREAEERTPIWEHLHANGSTHSGSPNPSDN
jgi:hypothetical protein